MKHNLEVVQDCSEVWCPKGRRGLLSVFKYISYNRVIFFLLLDWNVSYTSNSNLYPSWHQIEHLAWIYTIQPNRPISAFTVPLALPPVYLHLQYISLFHLSYACPASCIHFKRRQWQQVPNAHHILVFIFMSLITHFIFTLPPLYQNHS